MSEKYYQSAEATLYQGDCLHILRTLPDNSVDAVVTDPPAGIGFMGKEWDGAKGGREQWSAWLAEVMAECLRVAKPGAHALVWALPRTSHWTACGLEDGGWVIRDRIAHLFGTGFPKSLDVSKAIDRARDDRDAVLAVTMFMADAADSRGVTRSQVDKYMGTTDMGGWWLSRLRHRCQCPRWDQWLQLKGLLGLSDEMDAEVWRLNGRKGTPGESWGLREVVGTKRAIPGVAFSSVGPTELDITAPATDAARQWEGWGTSLKPSAEDWWWGTKPGVLGDSTSLDKIGRELDRLEAECSSIARHVAQSSVPTRHDELVAKIATAPVSAATQPEADRVSGTGTGPADASPEATVTSAFGSMDEKCLSIVTSWRRCWDDLCSLVSTSTTETTSSTTTDLRTLSSSLSRITGESMVAELTRPSGSPSLVEAADNLFAVCVLSSRATHALSAVEPATSQHQIASEKDRPSAEDWWLARKPMTGTVAQNVMQHGTGALNVDGCRVAHDAAVNLTAKQRQKAPTAGMRGLGGSGYDPSHEQSTYDSKGRWPPNTVFTHSPDCGERCVPHCPCAVLDQQSGERPGASSNSNTDLGFHGGGGGSPLNPGYGDTGGASRFFPRFRPDPFLYTAKAASAERPRAKREGAGNGQQNYGGYKVRRCGTCAVRSPATGHLACGHVEFTWVEPFDRQPGMVAHPTVKPLDLMRWLVRLITPPGGVVLDPFAGSGTTGEAALMEGMRCVLIEREADYLPLIVQRLTRQRDPMAHAKVTGTQGDGLW